MRELRGIDLKRACLVPSSVFASPLAVVKDTGLSLPQKLAILRRWEFDARRVAGIGGLSMLREVRHALQQVSASGVPVTRIMRPDGAEPAPAHTPETAVAAAASSREREARSKLTA
jgi:hypothetical protein